jgi:hypothetical protein
MPSNTNFFKPKFVLHPVLADDESIYYDLSLHGDESIIQLLIEKNKIVLDGLCKNHNPLSTYIFEKYIEKINWYDLTSNPNAICLIEKHLDKIVWSRLSLNPHPRAIHMLEEHPENINWYYLSTNPGAISLLKKNIKKIEWSALSQNTNPLAIQLMEEHLNLALSLHKVSLYRLTENPSAIHIIEKRFNLTGECYWMALSKNSNAIHILEKNIDKLSWYHLLQNPNAIHLIEPYVEKHDMDIQHWISLLSNPNPYAKQIIIKLDYDYMKNGRIEFNRFANELTSYIFNPDRLEKMYNLYYSNKDDVMFIDMLDIIYDLYSCKT